jgi:hypothetical protein
LEFIIKKNSQNSKSLPPKKSLIIIKIQLETEKPDLSKKYAISLTRSIVQFDYIFTYILRFHFCPTPVPPPHLPTNHISPPQPTYVLPTPLLPTYLPSGWYTMLLIMWPFMTSMLMDECFINSHMHTCSHVHEKIKYFTPLMDTSGPLQPRIFITQPFTSCHAHGWTIP